MRARGLPAPLVLAWVLGFLVVFVVWSPLLLVPGELFQRDLIYPWFGEDALLDFHPLLGRDGLPALGHLTLMPLYLPAVGIAQVFNLDGTAVIRIVIVQIVAVAYTGAFIAFLTLAGNVRWSTISGAIVAGIFASTNPWVVARVEHLGLLAGYAFVPLAIAAIVTAERRQSWRMATVTGIALSGIAISPHYVIYMGLIGIAGAILVLLRGPRRTINIGVLQRIGVALLVFITLEAYAVTPFISSSLLAEGLPNELIASDLAVRSPDAPLIDAITLTSNPQWATKLRPIGLSPLVWRGLALIPMTALLLVVISRFQRKTALLLLVAAFATTAIVAWADSGYGRPVLETVISSIPGGRSLREPDKLLGLSAHAQAWGLGAVVTLLWSASSQAHWVKLTSTTALVIILTSIILPATDRLLWTENVSGWRPTRLPNGYASVLETVRADSDAIRVAVFERGARTPDWDPTRILRHVATRSISAQSVVSERVASVSKGMELLRNLHPDELLTVLRAEGVNRVLITTDTKDGRDLASRLTTEANVTMIDQSDWLTYVRIAGETPVAQTATAWSIISGIRKAGTAPSNTAPFPVDTSVRTRPDDLAGIHILDSTQTEPRPELIKETEFTALTPATNDGWTGIDSSPAGFARWLRVLDIHGLHVDAFDNGLGFAWTSASTKPTPTPKIIQEISIPEGTSDVLLRALVGKNVAALHIRVVQAGSELKTTVINRPGFERFEWVQVANSVSSIGGPLLLEIGASKGFAAANGVGLVPHGLVSVGLTSDPAPTPQIVTSRRSRTEIDVAIHGARNPFVLVLNETFHPAWRASWEKKEARPVPIGLARMGFVIDEAGDVPIQVRFAPQHAGNIGLGITLVTSLLLTGLFVTTVVDSRKANTASAHIEVAS